MPPSGPVDHVVTSGTFSLDGGTWDVDNNVWVVGDENEVLVVDAAHDPAKIAEAIGGRRVVAGTLLLMEATMTDLPAPENKDSLGPSHEGALFG